MIMYVAGHGHTFEKDKEFCKWLEKHDTNFLVSFAYPDYGRMRYCKQIRDKTKKRKGQKK